MDFRFKRNEHLVNKRVRKAERVRYEDTISGLKAQVVELRKQLAATQILRKVLPTSTPISQFECPHCKKKSHYVDVYVRPGRQPKDGRFIVDYPADPKGRFKRNELVILVQSECGLVFERTFFTNDVGTVVLTDSILGEIGTTKTPEWSYASLLYKFIEGKKRLC